MSTTQVSLVEVPHKHTIITHDVVVVELTGRIADTTVTVAGVAKRHPQDKHNKNVGIFLAESRAWRAWAKRLEKRGNGLVVHLDNNKALQEKIDNTTAAKAIHPAGRGRRQRQPVPEVIDVNVDR